MENGMQWKKFTVMTKYKGTKKKSTMLNLYEYYVTVASLSLLD